MRRIAPIWLLNVRVHGLRVPNAQEGVRAEYVVEFAGTSECVCYKETRPQRTQQSRIRKQVIVCNGYLGST